jgi:NAD(P)-dependent dehydrogenase (short-subunit alcohol dehydrogenase family)
MSNQTTAFPNRRLDGKVAFITGAGRGMGRASALHLAKLGADIAINDIDLHAARSVGEQIDAETSVDEVRALGRRAIGLEGDITSEANVNRMVRQTLQELGRIDILINNVGGVLGGGPASKISLEQWRADIDLNLTSAFLCCRAIVPHMRERGTGKIVNVSSVSGLRPMNTGLAAYSAAKAGMHALTRSLALELAPIGITVNTIAFGEIDTYMFRTGAASIMSGIMRDLPMKRIGSMQDCVNVVEFLSTEQSAYVTGQTIVADGGWIELNPNFLGGDFVAKE